MRAVDTNVLVYAEVISSAHHQRALALITELATDPRPWAIRLPCVPEFLRVVTHPRVFHPPVPLQRALEELKQILGSPSLRLLSETPHHAKIMGHVLEEGNVSRSLTHDAHIAALCIEHGVSELITWDRDFSRFPDLNVVVPFA